MIEDQSTHATSQTAVQRMPHHLISGNPLWRDWVEELAETAEKNGQKSAKTYKRAAYAFKSCPITFTHPDEALQLSGVGPKIVAFIKSKLKEHCENTGEAIPCGAQFPTRKKLRRPSGGRSDPNIGAINTAETSRLSMPGIDDARHFRANGADFNPSQGSSLVLKSNRVSNYDVPITMHAPNGSQKAGMIVSESPLVHSAAVRQTAGTAKAKGGPRPYVPQKGSGAYAIILALYTGCADFSNQVPMLKTDIIALGQPYSSKSFSHPSSGHAGGGAGFFTAWNSMKTLIEKKLVVSDDKRPIRYTLSESGYKLARGIAPVFGVLRQAAADTLESSSQVHSRQVTESKDMHSVNALKAAAQHQIGSVPSTSLPVALGRSTSLETDGFDRDTSRLNRRMYDRLVIPSSPFLSAEPKSARCNTSTSVDLLSSTSMTLMRHSRGADASALATRYLEGRGGIATIGVDRPFRYFFLDTDDKRVMRREEAELAQEEGSLQPLYRIEYRTVQDLHPMARSLIRSCPLDRALPISGSRTMSGYMRARVSEATCPGFSEKSTSGKSLHSTEQEALGSQYPKNNLSSEANLDSFTLATENRTALLSPTISTECETLNTVFEARLQRGKNQIDEATKRSDVVSACSGVNLLDLSSEVDGSHFVDGQYLDSAQSQNLIKQHRASPPFRSIILKAGTFQIVLIIDTREVGTSKQNRNEIVSRLYELGIKVDRKMLPLGDMIWVARQLDGEGNRKPMTDDIVLDAIVERKRLDDLCSSITDGRYLGQKIRMIDSAISQRIYLIENYDADTNYARWGKQIWTSKSQLQVSDGFYVHESSNVSNTISFLKQRSQIMCDFYESSDLYVIPDEVIDRPSYISLQGYLRSSQPYRTYLTSYSAFESLNKVDAALTLRTQFAMMIQRIPGVSVEKAAQFLERWATPMQFFEDAEAHRLKTEHEAQSSLQFGIAQPKGRKRKAEEFVVDMLGGETRLRGIKGKLGAKIYHLFQSEAYTS